jgi:hypothetical protein
MEEALAERARANKRIRELRKQEKTTSLATPHSECLTAAMPTSIAPDESPTSAQESSEERPAKLHADAYTPLRAVLAKYKILGHDVWHVPALDCPPCLQFLGRLDDESLMASLGALPVRHRHDKIAEGEPQFIGGDHKAHGGTFREKSYKTLLFQTTPTSTGIWTNRYPGTNTEFHASTSCADSVPLVAQTARDWNDFLRGVDLPPCNIVMDRWYEDGVKHIGWHSDAVEDLHELGLIAVLRGGRRGFQVRDKESKRVIFDRVLEPFDLVIMTAHGSNLATEHCVPKEVGAAPAHSLTFRTSIHLVEPGGSFSGARR